MASDYGDSFAKRIARGQLKAGDTITWKVPKPTDPTVGRRGVNPTMVWKDEAANVRSQGIREYHSFTVMPGPDDLCGTCLSPRFNSVHFNGDVNLAKLAEERHEVVVQEREGWERTVGAGAYVQVREEHPRDDLRGRTGTVVSMSVGSTSMVNRGRGSEQKLATVKFAPPKVQTLTIPVRMLQPSRILSEVPQFGSQEEADKWLEDAGKELGVVSEREVPYFASPEEAQEWLERQAGELFVPNSFKDLMDQMNTGTDAARKMNTAIFDMLKQAVPQGVPASWKAQDDQDESISLQSLHRGIEAMREKVVLTAQRIPYGCPQCGYVAQVWPGEMVEHKEWIDPTGVRRTQHKVV